MLGTRRFFTFLVLTATVSITLSSSEEGGNVFSRLFNHGKGFFSSSSSSSAASKSAQSHYHPAPQQQQTTPQKQQQALKPKTASSRSWNVTSAASSSSSAAAAAAASSSSGAVSQARGYQSHGGGGWGWPSHGDDYVYSHSTYGKGQGVDINTLIGGLSLAGLLGVALFALSRPATTTIMMMNATGRRRRSTDDFDEDDLPEGETMPEFLSKIGQYFEKSWAAEDKTKKVEPFKLY